MEAFHVFNMQMPIIVPRLEFTLVEGSVRKYMSKYDLTFEDVLYRFEEKKQAWLDDRDTLNLADQFVAARESFRSSYQPLVESLGSIHSGVKDLGDKNLAKIIDQIDYLETKAQDAYKASFDASLKQLDRISLSLFPLAKPQERVYNICAYLNRYGDDWLKQLIETPWSVDGLHRVYYL
ncbi:putative cysteine ligase BshC [compost metagenome]